MPRFTVTVRHGSYRYHTFEVDAPDLAAALKAAAEGLPSEVRSGGNLAEVRRAPEPDERDYLGG